MRSLIITALLVLSFSVFDALIHGGIAASMQASGVYIQTISDIYQLGFALAMAGILGFAYFGCGWHREVLATLVLLFGLLEDMLYYLLMPLINPLISLLTDGAMYHTSGGGLLPPHVAGWIGWVSRTITGETVYVPLPLWLIINTCAIAFAIFLLQLPRHKFSHRS